MRSAHASISCCVRAATKEKDGDFTNNSVRRAPRRCCSDCDGPPTWKYSQSQLFLGVRSRLVRLSCSKRGSMFSAQQPRSGASFGGKSGAFGTGAFSQTPTTPGSAGQQPQQPPAQGAWPHMQSGWNATQGATLNTNSPGMSMHGHGAPGQAPQSTGNATWGSFGTPQSQLPGSQSSAMHGAMQSPASQHNMNASPAQHSQAPVNILPGYLNKLRSGGDRGAPTHRAHESTSPPTRDADSSLVSQDGQGSARMRAEASPSNRFSSSFFSGSTVGRGPPGDDRARVTRSPSYLANSVREGSVFGHGGLRGSRRAPDEPDALHASRAPTSPPLGGSSPQAPSAEPFNLAAMAADEDDAPPQDALTDAPRISFPTTSAPTALAKPVRHVLEAKPLASDAPMQSLQQRVVLVYGFPHFLKATVVDLFSSIGGLLSADDAGESAPNAESGAAPADLLLRLAPQSGNASMPGILRLTFTEPYQALHAVRRSGEVVSNTVMIGVRWADDNMHQLSVIKGADAPLLSDGAAPARGSLQGNSISSTPGAARAPTGGASGAGPSNAAGTPRFGRPIHVIDTPVSALAQHSSPAPSGLVTPLRAVVNASEALWKSSVGTATAPCAKAQPASTSLLGRLGDALFGW